MLGPSPLRSCPELWSVSNSSSKPRARKNLAAAPQLCVSRNTASMPSVVTSFLLSGRAARSARGRVEVLAQRLGDERRQRLARFDGVVLHLLDQLDRQVHVELLDFLVAHEPNASTLASWPASHPVAVRRGPRSRTWGRARGRAS